MTEGPPSVPPPGHPGPYAPPPAGPHAHPAPAGPYGPPAPYGPPPYPPPATYAPPPSPGRRSRRGLWIGLGAAVLALSLCSAVSLVGLKSYLDERNDASAAALDDEDNPIRQEKIEALLAEHTKALTERNEKTFVAPFDPTTKGLVAEQSSLYRNLSRLPLADVRFTYRHKGDFRPVGGGHEVDVTVAFVHRFDGFDVGPVEEWYRWTIVQADKDAPLKVTRAGGLPEERKRDAITHYPAPWDKWRNLHVERTPHTVLLVDASLRAEAQRYAPIAEQAAVDDLAAWQAGGVSAKAPSGFVISLVKGRAELGSLYRTTKETPTESGVAIPVPPEGVLNSDEKGPVVGATRVVIDVRDAYHFTSGTRERQLNLFRHEIGHALVGNLSARAPGSYLLGERETWLVEGFAEYLGHGRKPWLTSERTANARAVIREIGYPTALPGSQSFDMEGRGDYYYWLGHSAIGFIVERYGEQKMFQFVAENYRSRKIGEVTQDVLGVSYEEFEKAWLAYLRAEVR
ncbi:gluzincin family metallopeptidase [Micromonospora inositola]|uniref:Peptidase MA superfamily n=1 Tax=Micromonospora inositola TaxID=47865 RepID=A0A1C5HUE1_9ACTN|nr:hypothetical protein [Micromonospora inositola]SCG49634.1 hypothetical protein GA0070613_1835 [Micromonospora inositola]